MHSPKLNGSLARPSIGQIRRIVASPPQGDSTETKPFAPRLVEASWPTTVATPKEQAKSGERRTNTRLPSTAESGRRQRQPQHRPTR